MDDLISRKTVLALPRNKVRSLRTYEVIEETINVTDIEHLPSAQLEPHWIPCSERLPDADGEYLTTLVDVDGLWIDVTEWQCILGGRWIEAFDECDYSEVGNVIAWMPLPEPYKEESDE